MSMLRKIGNTLEAIPFLLFLVTITPLVILLVWIGQLRREWTVEGAF